MYPSPNLAKTGQGNRFQVLRLKENSSLLQLGSHFMVLPIISTHYDNTVLTKFNC